MGDTFQVRCAECDARLADAQSAPAAGFIYVCAKHVAGGQVLGTRSLRQAAVGDSRALLEKHGAQSLAVRALYGAA